jgi:rhodanese-related sulfurtransferase
MIIEKILREKKGTVVDVRTPAEFRRGNISGAVNIPLQELETRLEEVKSLNTPLVLCCASGTRSAIAESMLSHAGIECYNAGSWMDLQ